MLKYILKRLGIAILVLFGVSVIIYSLTRLMPLDFVDNKYQPLVAQGQMKQEDVERMKELYGLADKSFMGLVKGYGQWIGNVVRGDLGLSFYFERPVSEVIFENMGISFILAFISLILEFAIAIPLGIKAATHQYGALDYSVTALSMVGIALPSFFLGAIFIRFFGVQLGWFPVNGLVSSDLPNDASQWTIFWDKAYHLVMPMVVLTILSIGGLMRHTRTNTLEVLNTDYIRTARAKGCSEHTVIYKHAFRNTMIPLVTMLAGILPGLFGGAMITEQVFSIPGIGQMAYTALQQGDVPFIMGYNMFLAILTVIGTLMSDMMYMVVDPRVKINK